MENDPSIWALFSKDMGDERFQVRMPGEPVYKYSDEGDLEISSSEGGQFFQLKVEESGPEKGDLLYQSEGKWVREHFVRSGAHFYHFTTLSDTPESGVHDLFISSFFIEKN